MIQIRRREEANPVILGLAKKAATIKEIVRRTGHSRGLVRKVLRGQRSDILRAIEATNRDIVYITCFLPNTIGIVHQRPSRSRTSSFRS